MCSEFFAYTITGLFLGAAYSIAEHTSKQGAYVSLTVTVRAESRAQADAVYRELVAHELILMAL